MPGPRLCRTRRGLTAQPPAARQPDTPLTGQHERTGTVLARVRRPPQLHPAAPSRLEAELATEEEELPRESETMLNIWKHLQYQSLS